jgi:hypothetical protein
LNIFKQLSQPILSKHEENGSKNLLLGAQKWRDKPLIFSDFYFSGGSILGTGA